MSGRSLCRRMPILANPSTGKAAGPPAAAQAARNAAPSLVDAPLQAAPPPALLRAQQPPHDQPEWPTSPPTGRLLAALQLRPARPAAAAGRRTGPEHTPGRGSAGAFRFGQMARTVPDPLAPSKTEADRPTLPTHQSRAKGGLGGGGRHELSRARESACPYPFFLPARPPARPPPSSLPGPSSVPAPIGAQSSRHPPPLPPPLDSLNNTPA